MDVDIVIHSLEAISMDRAIDIDKSSTACGCRVRSGCS